MTSKSKFQKASIIECQFVSPLDVQPFMAWTGLIHSHTYQINNFYLSKCKFNLQDQSFGRLGYLILSNYVYNNGSVSSTSGGWRISAKCLSW